MKDKEYLEDPGFWWKEYEASRKRFTDFRETGKRIYRKYQNENQNILTANKESIPRSNILWSNWQIEKPAYYSRVPKVVTKVKYKSSEVAEKGASLLESATCFEVEEKGTFDDCFNDVVQDFGLAGRGVARVKLNVQTKIEEIEMPVLQVPVTDPMTGEPAVDPMTGQPLTQFVDADNNPIDPAQIQQNADGDYYILTQKEDVDTQSVEFDYVDFSYFNHAGAKSWKSVWWVSFDAYLSEKEVISKFGRGVAKQLNYSYIDSDVDTDQAEREQDYELDSGSTYCKKALIVEVWDKHTKKVRYIARGLDKFLLVLDDPLGLKDFFPTPKPLYANKTTRSLIGRPTYTYYEAHVSELDNILFKRYVLIDALRVTGVFDKSLNADLKNIFKVRGNRMIPVDWPRWAENGGFKGVFEVLPLQDVVLQIQQLYEAEQTVLQRIYDISGISDIMRGSNNPNSTATAEQIKGQFSTLRIAEKQKEIQRYARDLIALAAEIIAEHFSEQTFELLSGEENYTPEDEILFKQAIALLRQDGLRRIKIDIETDSTIAIDEALEKQQLSEYLSSVGGLLQTAIPFITQFPSFTDFFGELLKKTSRTFRLGRGLDAALEAGIQQLKDQFQAAQEAQAQQEQEPPPPQDMTKVQVAEINAQSKERIEAARLQKDYELQMAALQQNEQHTAAELAIKAQKIAQDWSIEQSRAASKDSDRTVKILTQRPQIKRERRNDDD